MIFVLLGLNIWSKAFWVAPLIQVPVKILSHRFFLSKRGDNFLYYRLLPYIRSGRNVQVPNGCPPRSLERFRHKNISLCLVRIPNKNFRWSSIEEQGMNKDKNKQNTSCQGHRPPPATRRWGGVRRETCRQTSTNDNSEEPTTSTIRYMVLGIGGGGVLP